jgi:hypothetical protein
MGSAVLDPGDWLTSPSPLQSTTSAAARMNAIKWKEGMRIEDPPLNKIRSGNATAHYGQSASQGKPEADVSRTMPVGPHDADALASPCHPLARPGIDSPAPREGYRGCPRRPWVRRAGSCGCQCAGPVSLAPASTGRRDSSDGAGPTCPGTRGRASRETPAALPCRLRCQTPSGCSGPRSGRGLRGRWQPWPA